MLDTLKKNLAAATNKVVRALGSIRMASKDLYFGFIQGHGYLSSKDLGQIKSLLGCSNNDIIEDFECEYASIVGDGGCVAFAAGRMSFFAVMQALGIGSGDEVILTGSTCAVMSNAVLRVGARPVYADIDTATLGSSFVAVVACTTSRTRLIVAQHSFGIPCDIEAIASHARSHSIFLLEDCALALGSTMNSVSVGNFGDAAIFSTDHSKPINTMIGGLVYTKSELLLAKVRRIRDSSPEVSFVKQRYLWYRLLLERYFCRPDRYGFMAVIDILLIVAKKFQLWREPFFVDDYCSSSSNLVGDYCYPSKLPSFLAQLGLYELRRWPDQKAARQAFLFQLLSLKCIDQLPAAYYDRCLTIVPLRLAWFEPNGGDVRKSLAEFLHVSWTWFMQPIIATQDSLESFGYRLGSCPVSEKIGPSMVNLPCNISPNYEQQFLQLFQKAICKH